jgi:Protein of unknown function (DUF3606)
MQDFKPLDPGRVNAIDPVEVKYWCKVFNCTEDQLANAVAKVGEHVTEVREFLSTSNRPR